MHSHFIMISCWLYTQNIWIYPYTIYPPQIADNHQFHYIIYIYMFWTIHIPVYPSFCQLIHYFCWFQYVPITSRTYHHVFPIQRNVCLYHLILPDRISSKPIHLYIYIYICIYIHVYIYISEWRQHDIIHLKTIHIHVWNIWYIVIYIIRIHNIYIYNYIYIHHQWKLDL